MNCLSSPGHKDELRSVGTVPCHLAGRRLLSGFIQISVHGWELHTGDLEKAFSKMLLWSG